MKNQIQQQLIVNLKSIRERMALACERAGRPLDGVTLVAVTKNVEPEVAKMLIQAQQPILGENRIQEAERKRAALGELGDWHMIGHLQRNKVKKAVPLFSMVHSVDSKRLLLELSKQCEKQEKTMEILYEVNVSGEAAKFGMAPSEVQDAVLEAKKLPNLKLRGLMTMAPYDPEPENARSVFRGLKKILDQTKAEEDFDLLSMGMSGDFEVAIEEGATHVRVGTSLYHGLKL